MQKRKVILAMQMTFDGYIVGPNDEMDWIISSQDEWTEMFKDLQSADTFLLGRKMYPGYAGFWRGVLADPSSPPDLLKYAKLADQTPHIVFTNSDFKPDWKNTRVANNIGETITQLRAQEGKDIVVWGGATLAGNLINQELVDEYRITLNPNLLGGGKLLFGNLRGRRPLKLIDAKPLRSGNVIVRYQS
jgi:dihydrofolate reductase